MKSLFELLLHGMRLAVEAEAAFRFAIRFIDADFLSPEIRETRERRAAARSDAIFPAGAHPAKA
jgi:hypothetical protein